MLGRRKPRAANKRRVSRSVAFQTSPELKLGSSILRRV